jgi:hypothetical protein
MNAFRVSFNVLIYHDESLGFYSIKKMNIVTNQKKQFIKLGKIIPNSESINIYAIVTEFAIHHHEGLFYTLQYVIFIIYI